MVALSEPRAREEFPIALEKEKGGKGVTIFKRPCTFLLPARMYRGEDLTISIL